MEQYKRATREHDSMTSKLQRLITNYFYTFNFKNKLKLLYIKKDTL